MQQVEAIELLQSFVNQSGLPEDVKEAYNINLVFGTLGVGEGPFDFGDLGGLAAAPIVETADGFEFSGTVEDQLSTVVENAVVSVGLVVQFRAHGEAKKELRQGRGSGVSIVEDQDHGQAPGLNAA